MTGRTRHPARGPRVARPRRRARRGAPQDRGPQSVPVGHRANPWTAQDFAITNPELRETIERERARLDAATKADVEPEPSQEPDIAPEATPGRAPPTEELSAPTEDVDPELVQIAALHKNADERGINVKWDLAVPESWDGDVDRRREFLLRAANGEIPYQGRHSVREITHALSYHHRSGTDQAGAFLEGAVEALNAARERSPAPQR